jgi:DNA-directed RNA polymerase specialized sigma24 family protein
MTDLNRSYAKYAKTHDVNELLMDVHSYVSRRTAMSHIPDPEDASNELIIRVMETLHSYQPLRGDFRS